jgi:hypothetical protein
LDSGSPFQGTGPCFGVGLEQEASMTQSGETMQDLSGPHRIDDVDRPEQRLGAGCTSGSRHRASSQTCVREHPCKGRNNCRGSSLEDESSVAVSPAISSHYEQPKPTSQVGLPATTHAAQDVGFQLHLRVTASWSAHLSLKQQSPQRELQQVQPGPQRP